MARKGFTTGDFDPSFPLDDKFAALQRTTDRTTYHVCSSIYWHLAAATWREGKRISVRRVTDATDVEVAHLRRVGLIGADDRIPRGPFSTWIGAALKRRKAAADRQARRRSGGSSSIHEFVGTETGERVPERMSRVTSRESGQDRYVHRTTDSTERETDDVAGAGARGGNGFDHAAWATIHAEVDTLTGGGINGIASPYSTIGQRALELAGTFGLDDTLTMFRKVADGYDHPDARQIVTAANGRFRPFEATGRAKPKSAAEREQDESHRRIQADLARAGIRREA